MLLNIQHILGTECAALASYLYEHNFLRRENYVFGQGYFSGMKELEI